MSGVRRTIAQRDYNEAEIVTALRRAGASVERNNAPGVPDLTVGFRGRTLLVEVKRPGAKLTPDQRDWHARWQGSPVVIVHDVREAVAALLRPEAA